MNADLFRHISELAARAADNLNDPELVAVLIELMRDALDKVTTPSSQPDPEARARAMVSDRALVDELATAYPSMAASVALTKRIGFPPQRLPTSRTLMAFWHGVVHELRAGVITNGIACLLDEAFGPTE